MSDLVERPQYGLTASASEKPIGPRFLRITDIQNDSVDWASVPYCDYDQTDNMRYRLQPSDLVVARIGATTGKTYIVSDDFNAVFASYLIRLRTNERLVPEFLYYFTKSERYWQQINATKGGRLKQGINIPILQGLEIPLPPLPEQKAIAHVLRIVQQAKEATEKVIAATRQLKQSLMKHLFTYGPVPFYQADKVELRKTDIGSLPEHWKVLPLGSVLEVLYRYPSYYGIKYLGSGIPEVRGELLTPSGEIVSTEARFVSEETASRFPQTRLKEGDIVMSVRGTMGKVGIVRNNLVGAVITANLIRLSPKPELVDPEFLKFYLLSPLFNTRLNDLSPQTTIKTIQAPVLKSIPIKVPPLMEQRVIAEALVAVDRKMESEETSSAALHSLFESLLQDLMTGKVRVPLNTHEPIAEAV